MGQGVSCRTGLILRREGSFFVAQGSSARTHQARAVISLAQQVKERVRAVKTELRSVVKRLTQMNPGGPRWRGLEVDKEGLIEVAGVVCTK